MHTKSASITVVMLFITAICFAQGVSPLINATTINITIPGTTFQSVANDIETNIGSSDTTEGGIDEQFASFNHFWQSRISGTDVSVLICLCSIITD